MAETATVDTLFFFFSGHGYHSTRDGNEYLLMSDSVADDLEATSISLQTIVARLQEWEPRHLVLFIDACRETIAGHKGPNTSAYSPAVDINALLPAGNITFSSCSQGQRSYEHPKLENGLFTAALREGLSSVGRCRTLHELNAYLSRRVPELCRAYGKPLQQPVARLEPAEVLGLEIISAQLRNIWRSNLDVRDERRLGAVPRSDVGGSTAAIGVDFGTCNSLVARFVADGSIDLVRSPSGRKMVPSVVNFDRDLSYVVGWEALDADSTRPEGSVFYPKRWLGTPAQFEVYDKSLTPEFVCSLILRSLKRNTEEYLGSVGSVVASYPASYSIAQSNALRTAFDLAGYDVARFVSEPAVSAYLPVPGGKPDDEATMLVVDLGGGTLDVSVVERGEGVEEIKSTSGDGYLGGLDYDDALVEYVRDRVCELAEVNPPLSPYVEAEIRRESARRR